LSTKAPSVFLVEYQSPDGQWHVHLAGEPCPSRESAEKEKTFLLSLSEASDEELEGRQLDPEDYPPVKNFRVAEYVRREN
jgi:hypothetical protein